MSNEIIPTSEPVVDELTKTINHQVPDPSIANDPMYFNGKTQVEEVQQQQQSEDVEPTKHNYDDHDQQVYNKIDLEAEVLRKVFIGGLSYKTDDQNFKDYFSNYGDIVVCKKVAGGGYGKVLIRLGLYYNA